MKIADVENINYLSVEIYKFLTETKRFADKLVSHGYGDSDLCRALNNVCEVIRNIEIDIEKL